MDQCSHLTIGTTSHQHSRLLTDRRAHDLGLSLHGLAETVLTQRRLGHQHDRNHTSAAPLGLKVAAGHRVSAADAADAAAIHLGVMRFEPSEK